MYDIEIVDDWMFFYTKGAQDLSQPATWRMLEDLAGCLVSRVADLATRYRDGHQTVPSGATNFMPRHGADPLPGSVYVGPTRHLGQPGAPTRMIAPEGRRLRQRWSWGFLLFLGWFLLVILIQAYGRFRPGR